MKDLDSSHSTSSPASAAPESSKFSPWPRLKGKRVSYLTLPLLVMATIVEFVILATGWKYQQVVCLPQGMGVTFFGIGPIGATILAVELLKLPLAIWTASRQGWQKGVMIMFGLPLICLLTFQLVKDMAVYEMGVAMTPATQMLEKASAEEIKISQLNQELAGIEGKRAEREKKLAELSAKQAKAKADLEESLKRNDLARQDAISLTDYQKKELSEVEARQAAIIKQFSADTDQLTKAIADLRARREAEFARSSKDSVGWEARKASFDAAYARWHTEEARIDNAYQKAMADYANKKAQYEKDKVAYANASFVRRQLMRTPVDPGVPPVKEVNQFPKPSDVDGRPAALIAEIEGLIKAKEAELLAVNNQRRDRIAQVDSDARRLRSEFDQRSTAKREEADRKREELSAALVALNKQFEPEREKIDKDFANVAQKVDGIRAELDASRKRAEEYYEAREAAIRKTQVHRIATTVEIVRGLFKGERPMSIKATAKERGDILTDQISMVRIWVYPVLAFIVAFLPTLMVEIGFSTVFKPEQIRPPYRLGFLGRRLHWLYKRAGRIKILRAERIAAEAGAEIALREQALAEAQGLADKALFEKDAELIAAREALNTALAAHEQEIKDKDAAHEKQAKEKEAEWVAKLAGMADSLNRTVLEKDALRDFQKSEIERQVAMRQNAWSERMTQLREELDEQRTAAEAERAALMQEHHQKLLEVSEECKTQVIQARRQAADAELAAMERTARLEHDLKEALNARDAAEAQLKHQADSLALRLTQAQEEAARELEKVSRQEKHRVERQQLEFAKVLRQREEEFKHRLKQREQELSLAIETRVSEEKTKMEHDVRLREAEAERQLEARTRELESRWRQEIQQREDAAQSRLKQREQQLQAQADARLREVQGQAEEQLRRREMELERQLETAARDADAHLKHELQQKELAFAAKIKQREQELTLKAETRETELQNQWNVDLRVREEEWQREIEARLRTAENRLMQEAQQKEELAAAKSRQRDQQWQAKLDAARVELQTQSREQLRRREAEAEAAARQLEAQLRKEMQQKEEAAQARLHEREQELVDQFSAQAEARHAAAQAQLEAEVEKKVRAATEQLRGLLVRAEKERDEARESATQGARHVQSLEKRLSEASSFLTGLRNIAPAENSLSWRIEEEGSKSGL